MMYSIIVFSVPDFLGTLFSTERTFFYDLVENKKMYGIEFEFIKESR